MYSNSPAEPAKLPFVIRAMQEQQLYHFTRQLIDIDSTSGSEAAIARFVADALTRLDGLRVELYDAAPGRPNVFAFTGKPRVVMSTHLDTVPPFITSREDDERIHGRGACDAKGIIAAQVFAAAELLGADHTDFGLLFVVGEERNSAGALAANQRPVGSRFLINGEPTESKLIRAGKGVLRVNLTAQGRAAHSAYPELGESAIEKLLAALERLQRLELPRDALLGPTTLNIGTIRGGRAPNVIADHAQAELMFRLVTDATALRTQVISAVRGVAEAEFVLELPVQRFHVVPGFDTGVVAFGTDVPNLTAWGTPLLFGPGSIHVAHTPDEYINKSELCAAVRAYADLCRSILAK